MGYPMTGLDRVSMPKIAVVLPAYNEALTIAQCIESFHAALPDATFCIVNNRSTDPTADIARQTLRALGCSGTVIDEPRPGKGCAVRRAFLEIDADYYVLADADMTYPAWQVMALLQPVIAGEADMVVGDRLSNGQYAAQNSRVFHGVGNALVKALVNKLFGANLQDIMSGYRAFSRAFVKTYPIMVDGFEIETDMTLHALDKRFRITEVPVDYVDRPEGSYSKLNTFSDGMRVLKTISRILRFYRPLVFFGSLGLIFALLGLIAAIPVFNDWFVARYIYHVPLAILATGLELTALLFMSVALILDTIVYNEKCSFERSLLKDYRQPRHSETSFGPTDQAG